MTNGWRNDAPYRLTCHGNRSRARKVACCDYEESFVRFRGRWVAKGAAFLVLICAVLAVLSFVVMSL